MEELTLHLLDGALSRIEAEDQWAAQNTRRLQLIRKGCALPKWVKKTYLPASQPSAINRQTTSGRNSVLWITNVVLFRSEA